MPFPTGRFRRSTAFTTSTYIFDPQRQIALVMFVGFKPRMVLKPLCGLLQHVAQPADPGGIVLLQPADVPARAHAHTSRSQLM
eukprot:7151035-Pyramimonas_sp.AAC.2